MTSAAPICDRTGLSRVVAAVGLAAMHRRCGNIRVTIAAGTPAPGCKVTDVGVALPPKIDLENRLFIELSWVEGGRLLAGITCNPLAHARAADIARQLQEAGDGRSHGRILADTAQQVMRLLDENRDNIERVSSVLLREETLDAHAIQSVIGGN